MENSTVRLSSSGFTYELISLNEKLTRAYEPDGTYKETIAERIPTLSEILKEITNIIGEEQKLSLNIFNSEIYFYVYEKEIAIAYDKTTGEFIIETYQYAFPSTLSQEILNQLLQILKILNTNKEIILNIVK